MRLVHIEFEGTPEELEQLPASMKGLFGAKTAPDQASTDSPTPDSSRELRQHIASRSRSADIERLVNRYAEEVKSWEGVTDHIGESKNTKDGKTNYFSLYKAGTPTGAFVYVHPSTGKVELRLDEHHAEGWELAKTLDREESNAYRVAVFLVSEEALEVALELTKLAIEQAESE